MSSSLKSTAATKHSSAICSGRWRRNWAGSKCELRLEIALGIEYFLSMPIATLENLKAENSHSSAAGERRPGRWMALFRFEWTKMSGRRITWVPFLVIMLVATTIVLAFHNSQFKFQKLALEKEGLLFGRKEEFVNGYFMASNALNAMFVMLIPIFISVASGLMVAGEAEQG